MLEQPLRGDDVVTHIAIELVSPAGSHPGLARQVVDHTRAFERRGEVGAHQVELFEGEIPMARRHLEVLLLASAPVVVGEAVDADDLVAVGKQPLAQVRADETRGAGDDHFHRPQA